MPQARRWKDCGVYAIAFSVALAMGVNPSRQIFKQDVHSHFIHSIVYPCCICILYKLYMYGDIIYLVCIRILTLESLIGITPCQAISVYLKWRQGF